jgi:hypothetical protein
VSLSDADHFEKSPNSGLFVCVTIEDFNDDFFIVLLPLNDSGIGVFLAKIEENYTKY